MLAFFLGHLLPTHICVGVGPIFHRHRSRKNSVFVCFILTFVDLNLCQHKFHLSSTYICQKKKKKKRLRLSIFADNWSCVTRKPFMLKKTCALGKKCRKNLVVYERTLSENKCYTQKIFKRYAMLPFFTSIIHGRQWCGRIWFCPFFSLNFLDVISIFIFSVYSYLSRLQLYSLLEMIYRRYFLIDEVLEDFLVTK